MREQWFILSSTPEGLLIFVKQGGMDVDRDQGLQPAPTLLGQKAAFALSRPRGTTWV